MRTPKVYNMESPRTGNPVANQFIIDDGEYTYFQSYSTIIAMYPNDNPEAVILDRDSWDYSVTTGKYRNIFLGENKEATTKKIISGEYIIRELN